METASEGAGALNPIAAALLRHMRGRHIGRGDRVTVGVGCGRKQLITLPVGVAALFPLHGKGRAESKRRNAANP